jgi:hypothetical protein
MVVTLDYYDRQDSIEVLVLDYLMHMQVEVQNFLPNHCPLGV